jgi:hypothetical protein
MKTSENKLKLGLKSNKTNFTCAASGVVSIWAGRGKEIKKTQLYVLVGELEETGVVSG